jgi:hypothetical protein
VLPGQRSVPTSRRLPPSPRGTRTPPVARCRSGRPACVEGWLWMEHAAGPRGEPPRLRFSAEPYRCRRDDDQPSDWVSVAEKPNDQDHHHGRVDQAQDHRGASILRTTRLCQASRSLAPEAARRLRRWAGTARADS